MAKKISTPQNNDAKTRFSDEPTDKRIHEHLSKKDDIISEDDIRNVKTDESILTPNDAEEQLLQDNNNQDSPLIKDTEPNEDTPWNILDA